MKKYWLIIKNYRWKASYTIEGALIISICILVVTACILLGFKIYHESMDYFEIAKIKNWDVVETFRQIRAGKTILDGIINK